MGTAIACQKGGDNSAAISYFQKAIELDPKNEEYVSVYDGFKDSMSPIEVEHMIAIAQNDNDKEMECSAYILLGDKLYKDKKYAEALLPYEKAVDIHWKNKEVLLKIGNIHKNNKDWEKASEYYKKAISCDDKYTDAWFNLGLVYANTNKLTDAIECFSKVISLDPSYTYAYYALGLAYEYEHNNKKSIENYQKYVQLEQDKSLVNTINEKIKQLEKS